MAQGRVWVERIHGEELEQRIWNVRANARKWQFTVRFGIDRCQAALWPIFVRLRSVARCPDRTPASTTGLSSLDRARGTAPGTAPNPQTAPLKQPARQVDD